MVLLALGMAIGLAPLPSGLSIDPVDVRPTVQRLTEITVLVALMGVGLALDRPFSFRNRESWGAWSATWRLLVIAMPLTIAGMALLGWALGLAPAAALLLGALLSPTDPVLAGDVQVAGPRVVDDEREDAEGGEGKDSESPESTESAEEIDEKDEVRFALTSEAGLNDGLAFPFVYAAIFLAVEGPVSGWFLRWVGVGARRKGRSRRGGRHSRWVGTGPGGLPRAAAGIAARRAGRTAPRARCPRPDLRPERACRRLRVPRRLRLRHGAAGGGARPRVPPQHARARCEPRAAPRPGRPAPARHGHDQGAARAARLARCPRRPRARLRPADRSRDSSAWACGAIAPRIRAG